MFILIPLTPIPLWGGLWHSSHIGVRGMPERDIESLGVMGWGLEAARKFFRRRRRRRHRRRPPNFVRLQYKNS